MTTVDQNQCQKSNNKKVAELETFSGSSSAILHFNGHHFPAVIGKNGLRTDKYEGDECTPSGFLPLRRILYRFDRLDALNSFIPCQPLTKDDGWCDDVTHPDYNRQIQLPHPARHEKLWLDDGIYDLIGILGYNDDPIRIGLGSAIFLHVATSDMKPTAGCIALSLNDLRWVLEHGLEAIFISK
ncbi:hypothetical protein I4U23_020194 [Adineta vaga]|nr:hypothetical protein I4U23_020194 [Adineta vaga]